MKDNVLRGIQLLDEKTPGWRDKIDLEILDLADGCNCVLGQLFESYNTGTFKLNILGYEYGFNIPILSMDEDKTIEEFSKLTGLWLEILGEPS